MLRRILAYVFIFLAITAFYQCARKGTPTGGPKDVTPPVLIRAEPENMSTNFKGNKIRLYFDELVKLEKVQEQLIVSPPLKYQPMLSPQGNANKFVEIVLKDTLKENTTYTINFGQSIVDNNEGNPNSFLTYVFSTGDYIDSLELQGVVKDAFNKEADEFISVMLYSIDSSYTDSTIYKRPPNYITNTLDSTIIFNLQNLKEGTYALMAIKDQAKNNIFDQNTDKIAFIKDTVQLPTDSIYLLNLFREIPDYGITVPSLVAKNKISFGYYGEGDNIIIRPITIIPDSVKTTILKERDKDTLNFWFTPYEMDSILFTVTNDNLKLIDTFNVKSRKVGIDSLKLTPSQTGTLNFNENFSIYANTPLRAIDSSKIVLQKQDTLQVAYTVMLDSLYNQLNFDFKVEPNERYTMELLPGAVIDFFGISNDTLNYALSTNSFADYGDLTVNLSGNTIQYPIVVQLTNEKEEVQREQMLKEPKPLEFNNLNPGKYLLRVIFDANNNGQWDTGNYLKKIQPERVSYYPNLIEMRANWIENITFNILD
ncbi:Ig-like domain-containing protein [Maribacter sp. PR1]|uniref:Ig-like domain-containing protein n=1 Tax=Maribacter cobaltidurans TaxID=1178778 RepID=A0ABU7IR98_9FLAO|nr:MULTISPECIES: Ig-like domain-containing protein [Maribacter]MDC6388104.1 Ig-like domain-containing protein [Maribacter sp. PR1]MEE1975492.1 Ig-like domain-containing protein [Maribacter cobaltidurans]